MDLLADLEARGLVHDSTDRDALRRRLGEASVGVYCGFDPTADSLHVGHLLGQLTLRRFQRAGHRPFPLAGGATGMIGDPGGRSEERNLLDAETLRANVAAIKAQLERLLDFSPGPSAATLVDNATWTAPVSVLDFLRDVGKHFTVSQMLAKESVRARMEAEAGISYTEFSYQLLQANDFAWLARHHDVELQVGGSDQWGNITAGVELVRRTLGRAVHGLTWPLLTRADGQKMGKSVGGAVWLDPARTSPYQFHQYWVQVDDAQVGDLLAKLSGMAVEEVAVVVADHEAAPERRVAQRVLAREMTTLVHGADEADRAERAAAVLFGRGGLDAVGPDVLDVLAGEVPSTRMDVHDVADVALVDLLVATGLCASKGEARRSLSQGGISVNDGREVADRPLSRQDLLHGSYLLLRKGKRDHHLVRVTG